MISSDVSAIICNVDNVIIWIDVKPIISDGLITDTCNEDNDSIFIVVI